MPPLKNAGVFFFLLKRNLEVSTFLLVLFMSDEFIQMSGVLARL